MLKQAGRRLLVSPWFAAGAGVVIATGAIVYAPHASLAIPGAIQITKCKQVQCQHVTPETGKPPTPAGLGGGQVTASPNPLAGMTFSYQPLDSWNGSFGMRVTIHSTHSLGNWKLSFVIPGATGVYVYGARWRPNGTDGVTVSNYYGGTESAGYAPISGHQSASAAGYIQDANTVQLQVRGTGNLSAPADCSYNGHPCTFKVG